MEYLRILEGGLKKVSFCEQPMKTKKGHFLALLSIYFLTRLARQLSKYFYTYLFGYIIVCVFGTSLGVAYANKPH